MSIILKRIYKRLSGQLVVNNFSLEILDGELFVLLGASGSGKSTILRIIAGLIEADSGTVELNARDVTSLSPQKRNTGFVFQNYSVFQHMTARENVEFGLKIRNIPQKERKKKSAELLELIGLTGLESRYARQLSGGQQQRVAVARALAYNPVVLLLDEPFGALDVKIRGQLRRNLKLIQTKLKVTTILVTHDQEEAYELGDRIGIVKQGQLVEVNTPEELYYHPRYEYTATFIGGGNVLAGRKEKNRIILGSVSLPFPENAPAHDEKAPVKILFRPETAVLSKYEFNPEEKLFVLGKGVIRDIKFGGVYYRITLAVSVLRGSQILKPRLRYGQENIRVEAMVSGEKMSSEDYHINGEYWIGLKEYHVLDPSGLKILVYQDKSSPESPAAGFGLTLAKESGGSIHLLSIVKTHDQMPVVHTRLEKTKASWLNVSSEFSIQVKKGEYTEEVIKESQEGNYEIIIFDWNKEIAEFVMKKIGILLSLKIPILLVKDPPPHIKRILICTAAGEPGKEDIRFGGRVAKFMGASVTLLHVARRSAPEEDYNRASYHLELGKKSLEALDVETSIKIEGNDNPASAIISESKGRGYDLIVVGASFPGVSRFYSLPSITNQIINGSSVPVLIVPMEE